MCTTRGDGSAFTYTDHWNKGSSTMASTAELIAQLYIGFYDRAPDPAGLQYWVGRVEAGVSIQDIGDSFAASPEASDTYPYFTYPDLLSQNDFLEQAYQNVFGRAIDADGLAYYSARMEAGETAGSVVASILGNASTNEGTPDQAYLQNKVDAGLHWALEAAATFVDIYQDNGRLTDQASDSSHGILDGITADPATVEAANTATDAFFGGDNPGGIFTLTNAMNFQTGGVDVIHGTDGADNIRAILANSLDSTDVIDGGAGNDVLNISAGGLVSGAAPVISNVETINNNNTAATFLDLSSVTGVKQINSSASATYSHASLDTIYGISGSPSVIQIGIEASLAGANDTLHLAVDDAPFGIFQTVDAALADTTAGIEHITLEANGDAAAVPSPDLVLLPFINLETLTVTGAGDVAILAGSTVLETFDASAATGDVAVDLSASAVLETSTTGSGNDMVIFDAEDAVVSTGAGDDDVTVGAASDGAVVNTGAGVDHIDASGTGAGIELTINGGAGADTIDLGAGDENLVYTAQADSTYVNFDAVTDFGTAGTDTIDLSAFNLTGETDTVAAGITTATTIAQLAGGVPGFFNVGGDTLAVATFTEAGNTYVLADLNNDGNFNAANDLVIQLVGVPGITAADIVFA
ncbi:DUF4214 domain-containing protein [Mesorhizobium sp. A623]